VAALTSDVKPSDAKASDTNYSASDNVGKTTAATSGSPTSDRAAIAVTADAACDAATTAAKTTIAASDDIATQALSTATSGTYASGTPEGVEHDDEFDKEYVIPLWRHVMLPQPLLRYTLSSPDESYHPCCTPAVAWRVMLQPHGLVHAYLPRPAYPPTFCLTDAGLRCSRCFVTHRFRKLERRCRSTWVPFVAA